MSLNHTSLYLTFLRTTDYDQSETDADLEDFCFSGSKCSEEVNEVWSHNPELPDLKKQKLRSDHLYVVNYVTKSTNIVKVCKSILTKSIQKKQECKHSIR